MPEQQGSQQAVLIVRRDVESGLQREIVGEEGHKQGERLTQVAETQEVGPQEAPPAPRAVARVVSEVHRMRGI